MHPNNKLTINAIEAAPLEDFSPEVCTGGGMRGLIFEISNLRSHPRLFVRTFTRPKRCLAATVQRPVWKRMYMKRCSMHWAPNDTWAATEFPSCVRTSC